MKACLLVVSILILLLNNLFGEIKNGYERDIPGLRLSLEGLKSILYNNPHLTAGERRRVKENITSIVDFMVYYEITDTLLKQFRIISPELYNQIDTLKDYKGRTIDVFVKFIPKRRTVVQAEGMTSFKQSPVDPYSCTSEYGDGSVSVQIWILNKALWVLSHEFGHIQYLVPNLQSYVEFYKKKYRTEITSASLGHCWDDPSGKIALRFEERFRASYIRYLKTDVNTIMQPLVLVNPIKRNLLQDLDIPHFSRNALRKQGAIAVENSTTSEDAVRDPPFQYSSNYNSHLTY